jgi:DNA-binding response OmpR family regulator
MDDTPSDGNAQVVDIFIISTDETVAVPLKEQLGKKEFRVTVFADETLLKESDPDIRPDLLICDAQTGQPEGYEVIRRIKDDENQRGIPVLVLTAAATMEDLLRALESNADNFIAPPYDLPDNLSLMNDMLTTPVGPQTRDEIETQFRIRHDDKTYVIVATSRKLLEFLLSSFDIVVRKSSELSSLTTKLQALTASASALEQTITGQTQAAEILNTTVRQKEQTILALTQECEEQKKILTQKTNEQKDLTVECDALRLQVGKLQETLTSSTEALETERELRRVAEESARAAVQRHEEHEKHARTANEELERVNNDQVAVIGQIKEELKKATGRIQSLETEATTLATEKLHAEQEVLTLTKSATGLEQTIAGQTKATETLNVTVRQKEQTIIALTKECEKLEAVLTQEKNESNDRTMERDALRLQVGKLQETLTSSNDALATERELRQVAEESARAAVQRQEEREKHARTANEELERVNNDQAAVIGQIKEELKKATGRIQSLETEVATLAAEKLHAAQEVRTLTAELGRTRTTLAHEYKSPPGIDEGHPDAGKEQHQVQQSLFSDEKNTLKESLDSTISDEANLPAPLKQLAQPLIGELTPGVQQPPVSKKDLVNSEPSGEIPPIVSGIISRISGSSDADSIFLVHQQNAEKEDMGPGPRKVLTPSEEKTVQSDPRKESSAVHDQMVQPALYAGAKPEKETAEKPESPGSDAGPGTQPDETAEEPGGTPPSGDISFTSTQWLDLLKWAHHTDALSPNQRQKIVMMGRLVQKDGKLTKRQQEQIREILTFVYARGYHP